jgi:hypothetical protein
VRTDENALLASLMGRDVFSDPWNQYQLQHDAIASLLFILEFLVKNNGAISESVKMLK